MNHCHGPRIVFDKDFLSRAQPLDQCDKVARRPQFRDVDHMLSHVLIIPFPASCLFLMYLANAVERTSAPLECGSPLIWDIILLMDPIFNGDTHYLYLTAKG